MSFKNCKVIGKSLSPSDYHNHEISRGDIRHPVSPSMLKSFAHCPSRWFNGYQSPDSDSKDFGNLLDTLVLTPELFKTRYALEPVEYTNDDGDKKPWHNGAKACKKWRQEQESEGRIITNCGDLADAQTASKRIVNDEILSSFINACDKQVLVEGEWHDVKTGLTLPVRCLIDLVPRLDTEFANCLGDLKSTRSASIIAFQRDVFRLGYHLQAGFDLDLYNAATRQQRLTWCFAIQENFEPYEIGRRMLKYPEPGEQPESGNLLNLGRIQYKKMLENYAWCLKNKQWPSYDDSDESSAGWTLCAAEPWMESQVLFAPKFGADSGADEPAPIGDDLYATA